MRARRVLYLLRPGTPVPELGPGDRAMRVSDVPTEEEEAAALVRMVFEADVVVTL